MKHRVEERQPGLSLCLTLKLNIVHFENPKCASHVGTGADGNAHNERRHRLKNSRRLINGAQFGTFPNIHDIKRRFLVVVYWLGCLEALRTCLAHGRELNRVHY